MEDCKIEFCAPNWSLKSVVLHCKDRDQGMTPCRKNSMASKESKDVINMQKFDGTKFAFRESRCKMF